MATRRAVLLLIVIVAALVAGSNGMLNSPPVDKAPPRTADIPFIKCGVCKQFVHNAILYASHWDLLHNIYSSDTACQE